jgi:ankyrin repeat protein
VNGSNPKEHTVLHHAAFKGHVVVVSTLLTAGATVNRKNAWGDTALCTSVLGAVLGTADYRKHAAVVAALIAAGEKVDEKNAKGETALCIAIAKGQYAIVNALLAGGANVNTVRTDGRTHLGSVINLLETTEDEEKFATALCIMSSLLRAGADVNVIDDDGNTPLINIMRIRDSGYLSSALPQLLEVAGAKLSPSINHTNRYGQTALTMALEKINDLNIIKRLLAAGADPSLGKLSNLTPLQYAAFLGNTPVANLIMHTLISQGKPLECFADDSFSALGKSRIFLHVIAQGGDYVEENMEYLLRTAWGLRVLSKTEGGKLPEQIVSNPALKARMKALREGYEWFQRSLRVDISRDVSKLTALQSMAKYITSQPKDSGNFPPMEWDKAARILADLPLAIDEAALNARILEADDAVSGVIEELKGHIGQLNAASKDHKKKWNENIARACTLLETQYAVLRELTEAKPEARSKVEEAMIDLRDANETVRVTVNKLLPHARKKAAAGGAGGGGAAAAAAAASEPEERFDFATADLDVLTLEAWMKASKTQQTTLKSVLDGKIDAAKSGRAVTESTISDKVLKRYMDKVRHALEFSRDKFDDKVLYILDSAVKRGVPNKFIWSVLRFSEDPLLKAAHIVIEKVTISDAATFAPGSVHGSLVTPGGVSARAGFEYDGGSTMGGSVLGDRAGDFPEEEEESFEDRKERDDYRKAFTGLEIPVLELPNTLTEAHLATILNLFTRNYGDMDANGRDLYALFKALGERFDVKYDDDTKRTGNLKITDTQAAEALRAARQDPNYATACMDPKHSSADFKGLKRHMGERTLRLLTAAGITQEMVQDRFDAIHAAATAPTPSAAAAAASAFAMPGTGAKPGRGGSKSPSASGAAAAAAASVSSRTSGYSDYASGGGGGGGGGRSRTGGGAAASGGGGGGWNAARGSYTYGLPGK